MHEERGSDSVGDADASSVSRRARLKVLVVGSSSSNAGKTTIVAGIVAAFR